MSVVRGRGRQRGVQRRAKRVGLRTEVQRALRALQAGIYEDQSLAYDFFLYNKI